MKKSVTLIAAFAVVALGLSSCAHPALEVPDPIPNGQPGSQSESQSGAQSGTVPSDDDQVVLTAEQVDRIVAGLQEVLAASDESQSAEGLPERLVDPALAMREGQLIRAAKTGTELAPLIINNSVYSATAGTNFPRVLVVASEAEGSTPAEVFFLTQKDAKSDYMLENWTRLTGGTPVKGLAVRDGSTVLGPNASGLRLSPADTLTAYVNYLNSPDNAEYQVFTDNVFEPRFRQEIAALTEAIQVAGTVTAEVAVADYPVVGVALETGNALVSTAFTYTDTYAKTVEGATLELAGTPADYLDDPTVVNTVTVTYLVTMFFLIPPEGSQENIAVVGADRVIKSVERNDG